MRRLVWSFLTGAFIGAAISVGLFALLQESPPTNDAEEILDDAIIDWTGGRDSSIIEARIFEHRLPGARIGFFPDTVIILSRWVEETFKIPKGVTCAMWALESKFGLADLGANNYHGLTYAAVRKYMDDPDWVTAREQVVRNGQIVKGRAIKFAKFINISEEFETFGRYISGSRLYANAFTQLNPEHFAREVAKHYAEDPDYSTKLIVIMRRYKLE
jgi:hypothetical protein